MLLAGLVPQGEVRAPQMCGGTGFCGGLAGAHVRQGPPGLGCLGSFASLPNVLGARPCLQLVTHGCPSHQPFAHCWDSFWCRQDPPAQGTEPQHVITWDKLSFCLCRCCLLGTFSQVSLCSFPSGGFSQSPPPMHRTPPAHPDRVLCAHGRGSRDQPDPWELCRGPSSTQRLCPPAWGAGSWISQSIPCIPALFLPRSPAAQPLV